MYGYDDLGRLTNADWSTGAQTRDYDYDSIGNLERIGVNESLSGDGEVLFGYDPNPSSDNSPVLSSMNTYQGVTLTSSHTVVTDSAGNISDDGQAGYDYTLRNQLESRTLGVETSSYTFSADGRRVGMTRGATTLDVVLGLGGRRLSRVLDGATRDYVWLGDTLIGYFDGTATEPVRVVTSHIGFPLMAVDETGTTIWEPLHEPYGELIGTFSKSADPGLRYPGQWQDEVDIEGNCVGDNCTMPGPLGGSVSLFENGFRWYRTAWGRYSQSDPMGKGGDPHPFQYAMSSPLRYQDPMGLKSRVCCRPLRGFLRGTGQSHCYIEIVNSNGRTTCGLYFVGGYGRIRPDDGSDRGNNKYCGPWNTDPCTDKCVIRSANAYPNPSNYSTIGLLSGQGTNSNTFASHISRVCDLKPKSETLYNAPGWGNTPPTRPPGVHQQPAGCRLP